MRAILILFATLLLSLTGTVRAESPDISLWEHNGSIVAAHKNGEEIVIWYQNPSDEMRTMGVHAGLVLFDGKEGKTSPFFGPGLEGIVNTFSRKCNPVSYKVTGWVDVVDHQVHTITLEGTAPIVGEGCIPTFDSVGSNVRLVFHFIRFE